MIVSERIKNITKVVEQLDISPSLYRNAVEKYNNLAKFLNEKGIEADIYPQGSFALGTVVRPSKKNQNPSYDLDFICQVSGTRENQNPLDVYNQIKDVLNSDKTYRDRLDIWDECFTINYADIGDMGFSIDIVPATGENEEIKSKIKMVCDEKIADTAIAIPHCVDEEEYDWITNNPLGYRKWFNEINSPYKEASREQFRQALFESCNEYASIEEIPEEMERSSLQRVVQILKAHRNNYFSSSKREKMKPKSVIITTLVAEISSHLDANLGTFELLDKVLKELDIYSNRQILTESVFESKFGLHTAITRPDGEWKMPNPANPDDNLVDSWNEDNEFPKFFFNWLKTAQEELLDSLNKDDQEFRAFMENAFGQENIQKTWQNQYINRPAGTIIQETAGRPWGKA